MSKNLKEILEPGDVVVCKNRRRYMLINKKTGLLLGKEGYMELSDYSDNLTFNDYGCFEWDIMKVYRFAPGLGFDNMMEKDEFHYSCELLWERFPKVDIQVTINGEDAKLSDISKETLLRLYEEN